MSPREPNPLSIELPFVPMMPGAGSCCKRPGCAAALRVLQRSSVLASNQRLHPALPWPGVGTKMEQMPKEVWLVQHCPPVVTCGHLGNDRFLQ